MNSKKTAIKTLVILLLVGMLFTVVAPLLTALGVNNSFF